MVEPFPRQSPLAPRALAARAAADSARAADAAVRLSEHLFRSQIDLRGDPADAGFLAAVEGVLGAALPVEPNTVTSGPDLAAGPRALWLGPDQWLIVAAPGAAAALAGRLRSALDGRHFAVTDVSEARAVIALDGPASRDVLAKGCPLDLHPRVFGPGRCAQSQLAQASVILHQTDARPAYDLYVGRSFADYLWAWLEDAAAEHGYAVVAG